MYFKKMNEIQCWNYMYIYIYMLLFALDVVSVTVH